MGGTTHQNKDGKMEKVYILGSKLTKRGKNADRKPREGSRAGVKKVGEWEEEAQCEGRDKTATKEKYVNRKSYIRNRIGRSIWQPPETTRIHTIGRRRQPEFSREQTERDGPRWRKVPTDVECSHKEENNKKD